MFIAFETIVETPHIIVSLASLWFLGFSAYSVVHLVLITKGFIY